VFHKLTANLKTAYVSLKAIFDNLNQPQNYLALDNIVYSDKHKNYIACFNAIGGNYCVTLPIDQVILDDGLLNTISPIDAFICGITFNLWKNNVVTPSLSRVIDYFANYNSEYVCPRCVKLSQIDYMGSTITIKVAGTTRTIDMAKIAEHGFLIMGFSPYDAMTVGLCVIEYYLKMLNDEYN
jgi:hypothetical protein